MQMPAFRLERFFEEYEFTVPHVLCCSNCETFSIEEIMEGDLGDLGRLRLGYTETRGAPALRAELAALYKSITPDQIMVHAGAQEAIFALSQALFSPGDHVIVHFPTYQSLWQVAQQIGCRVTFWQGTEKNDWQLDLTFLDEHLTPQTRAVMLNLPHNPTGALISTSDFMQIVTKLRANHTILIVDEVYRFLEFDETDRLPAACDLYENAVSIGAFSKSLGLAGLRIGWLATRNEKIYHDVAIWKDYLSICNSAPSELIATRALQKKDRLLYRNRMLMRKNYDLLLSFLEEFSDQFEWYQPKAGPILFPRLKTGEDASEYCQEVLAGCGVLLAPGEQFHTGNQFIRIGYGREDFPIGLEKWADYLRSRRRK